MYNIRPGNEAGLFLQPRSPHRAHNSENVPTTDQLDCGIMHWDKFSYYTITTVNLTTWHVLLIFCILHQDPMQWRNVLESIQQPGEFSFLHWTSVCWSDNIDDWQTGRLVLVGQLAADVGIKSSQSLLCSN